MFLRKGADAEPTLKAIHKKVQEINDHILPPGVKIVPFLDRSDLIHHTTHTVLRNLTEGFILVSVVLFLFLGNARSALIVALTIPFSLLFASIFLDLRHIPANLLSLGALDFGMVVDGAVVMVENILRHLGSREDAAKSIPDRIRAAAHEVQRPVFYAITIIITAYLPIFTLQKVEGRIFRPMAWTVAFALLGALTFSILVAPVLTSFLFPKGFREWENPVLRWITRGYRRALTWTVHHRWVMVGVAVAAVCCSLYLLYGGLIGSEFLPHLDEGSIWAFGTAAPSIGPAEGTRVMNRARIILASFPEVKQVVSRVGRPDDGMDPVGFDSTEYFVDLKPKEQWRPVFHQDKDELIAAMNRQLEKIPGVLWHFTQPIADEMEEADTGVKGELAVKIYRRGPEDPGREGRGGRQGDAPDPRNRRPGNASRDRPAEPEPGGRPRRGCPLPDERRGCAGCHPDRGGWQCRQPGAAGRTALRPGGPVSSPLPRHQGSDREYSPAFALRRARLPGAALQDPAWPTALPRSIARRIRATLPSSTACAAATWAAPWRKPSARSTEQVKLPPRYTFEWAGEYESQKRSEARLLIIVPLTVFLIFLIIYGAFGSAKWACLHLVNVAVARVGGLLALYHHGHAFQRVVRRRLPGSVRRFGSDRRDHGGVHQPVAGAAACPTEEAAIEGAVRRLRPIMMTMLVATLGLLPAALSHDIGSDSQRPFAIVIVGGLIVDLIMSIFPAADLLRLVGTAYRSSAGAVAH